VGNKKKNNCQLNIYCMMLWFEWRPELQGYSILFSYLFNSCPDNFINPSTLIHFLTLQYIIFVIALCVYLFNSCNSLVYLHLLKLMYNLLLLILQ
jgi:hypothetical protein